MEQKSCPILCVDLSAERLLFAVSDHEKEFLTKHIAFDSKKVSTTLTTQLPFLVDQLFDDAQISFSDLKGIIITNGPASFTGLRIVLSYFQGIVFSLHLPVFVLNRFELIGEGLKDRHEKEPLSIALYNAKNDFYIADVSFDLITHHHKATNARVSKEISEKTYIESDAIILKGIINLLLEKEKLKWGSFKELIPYYCATPTYKTLNENR
jgi:tRNA threonylcarbamoyl adenosine modification protein YeaZ